MFLLDLEHEGGSSYSGRVRKVLDLTEDDDVGQALEASMAEQSIKKLKRTDSNTFQRASSLFAPQPTLGIARNIDKRWGKEPVQGRIVLRQAGTIPKTQIDDDDDIDDKATKQLRD